MPQYRFTLVQNMRADQAPSALQVQYTYLNAPTTTWPVTLAGPHDSAVAIVNSAVNLISPQDVRIRTLIAHYPTAPNTINYQISSVQPALELYGDVPTSSDYQSGEAAGTQYSVAFTMDQNTVVALNTGGFVLFGFKAVKAVGSGVPAVWFSTSVYGTSNTLNWQEVYQAYTSQTATLPGPGSEIIETNSYPIGLDQSLLVTNPTGTGNVVTTGTPSAISIVNQTSQQMTCGIAQVQPNSSTPAPICAFTLYGNMTDVVAPIEKVLLMFAAGPVNTGTVIEEVNSQGILIDLTGEQTVTGVSFNINTGWNTNGQPNCSLIPSNTNLVPLVIQSSQALSRKLLSRRSRAASR